MKQVIYRLFRLRELRQKAIEIVDGKSIERGNHPKTKFLQLKVIKIEMIV